MAPQLPAIVMTAVPIDQPSWKQILVSFLLNFHYFVACISFLFSLRSSSRICKPNLHEAIKDSVFSQNKTSSHLADTRMGLHSWWRNGIILPGSFVHSLSKRAGNLWRREMCLSSNHSGLHGLWSESLLRAMIGVITDQQQ